MPAVMALFPHDAGVGGSAAAADPRKANQACYSCRKQVSISCVTCGPLRVVQTTKAYDYCRSADATKRCPRAPYARGWHGIVTVGSQIIPHSKGPEPPFALSSFFNFVLSYNLEEEEPEQSADSIPYHRQTPKSNPLQLLRTLPCSKRNCVIWKIDCLTREPLLMSASVISVHQVLQYHTQVTHHNY